MFPTLKGTNLYLIGMMGSGKSTTGKRLAQQLGYRFFDTDTLIEQATGQSVSQLFADHGEAAFRQVETQVLAQVSAYTQLVVATGGGIVLDSMNWSYLHHGVVIWLDAPTAVLVQRLAGDKTRPLLQTANLPQKLSTLIEQRRQLYAQADVRVTVEAGESVGQVCDRALTALQKIIKPPKNPPSPPIRPLP